MKKISVKSIVETCIVVFSMVIAFLVFRNLDMETFIKPDDTPVTAAQIAASPSEDYAGKTAGDDIPRLSGIEDFKDMIGKDYATVEAVEVIPTGIYGLKSWVNPYEITKRRNSRGRLVSTDQRAPDATDSIVISAEYYQEYYLVRLPDQTYILAQFSDAYRDRLAAEGSVTLPIGIKKTTSNAAREYLESICDEYGAGNIFSLYMIDDTWQKSHENTLDQKGYGKSSVSVRYEYDKNVKHDPDNTARRRKYPAGV